MKSKIPSDAVACGFALVPEDRRKEGLVLSHTIKENAILPISAQLVKNGIFNDDKAAHDIVEKKYPGSGSCSRQYESGDQAALRWKPAEDCYCKMVKFQS